MEVMRGWGASVPRRCAREQGAYEDGGERWRWCEGGGRDSEGAGASVPWRRVLCGGTQQLDGVLTCSSSLYPALCLRLLITIFWEKKAFKQWSIPFRWAVYFGLM